MITQDQIKDLKSRLDALEKVLKISEKREQVAAMTARSQEADFWNDADASAKKTKELKSLKDDVAVYAQLEQQYEDIEAYIELGNEAEDEESAASTSSISASRLLSAAARRIASSVSYTSATVSPALIFCPSETTTFTNGASLSMIRSSRTTRPLMVE